MTDAEGLQVGDRTVTADALNIAALQSLQSYNAGALERVQSRAGTWIPGLVAITGVLAAAVVVKGPESFAKLDGPWQVVIIALLGAGGVAIALGTYWSYSAAYGDAISKNDNLSNLAKKQQLASAWTDYTEAIAGAVNTARSTLRRAAIATILGVVLLAAAVVLTWMLPAKAGSETFTCFQSETGLVKIEGSLPALKSGTLTVESCK